MAALGVTLWHIELSHYSEKARWALDYKGVPHRLRSPLPGLHGPVAMALTRSRHRRLPVLGLDGRAIPDSTAIIAALEERFPDPPLYPADSAERAQALVHEDFFDETLAPAVRSFVWSKVLTEGNSIAEAIAPGAGGTRQRAFAAMTPLVGRAIRADYAARTEGEGAAREDILRAADRVEAAMGPWPTCTRATAARPNVPM